MPKIDFYVLHDPVPNSEWKFTCRLLEKIYQTQQHHIYISVSDEATAHALDDLLWTFHDTSFIPHQLGNDPQPFHAPIIIGFAPHHRPTMDHDILVNWQSTVPEFFIDYDRVIEIVPEHDTLKAQARSKYKTYQQRGLTIQSNDIR